MIGGPDPSPGPGGDNGGPSLPPGYYSTIWLLSIQPKPLTAYATLEELRNAVQEALSAIRFDIAPDSLKIVQGDDGAVVGINFTGTGTAITPQVTIPIPNPE